MPALSAPRVLTDQELRGVIWNLETVGLPGSTANQAVATVLGRSDTGVVAIKP